MVRIHIVNDLTSEMVHIDHNMIHASLNQVIDCSAEQWLTTNLDQRLGL